MVAFLDAGSNTPELNIILSNGSTSQFKYVNALKEVRLQPVGVSVKRIVLWYRVSDALLYKIEMYAKDGSKILETGFNANGFRSHEIVLEDGERIIGIKSRTYSESPTYAYHCDF